MVFAPSPLLTITIEAGGETAEEGEIHLHAGGQGFWIGRMLAVLGARVRLCASFGGETGQVVRTLVGGQDLDIEAVDAVGSNGAYVHDRRSGERRTVAYTRAAPLSRHEVDELYGSALVAGLESAVCVLGGPHGVGVISPETYGRLASDLRSNGRPVVADLSGELLDAALDGGVTVLKVSHEELLRDGRLGADRLDALADAMKALVESGADHVVVTRAEKPAVALIEGQLVMAVPPPFEALDPRGAGDSFTAGLAAGLARGVGLPAALRLAAAAGSLNVTRRGLATGSRDDIEAMATHVDVRPLRPGSPVDRGGPVA